jgi:glycogen synthase
MRIGIFSMGYPGLGMDGGIGTYTRDLAHALSDLGHRAHVLVPSEEEDEIRTGPVTVHLVRADYMPVVDRLIPGLGACSRVATAMRRLVARHKLEIVEFPNWGGLGAWYALWRSVPLAVRLSTTSLEAIAIDGNPYDRTARWDVRREAWLARRADALMTHSDAHRRRIVEEAGIDARRITVVPLGIPTFPDFERPARRGDELRVVYLGRLERRKGTLDLLRAIPEVLREVPQARFDFIGSDRPHCPGGRTHAQFVEQELPAEVKGRVRLLGRLPNEEVDRALQAADLFVAPSLYESFGMIFLEAMRWGTPVVGTTAGGIPEVVEDGRTGVLVTPGQPGELAAAIVALLRDEPRRRALGEAGRRRVEAEFTVRRTAQRTAEIYERAIKSRGRRWAKV